MLGKRLLPRSGAEDDAINRKWRHRLHWHHVRRSWWKRRMRRRERKEAKQLSKRKFVL